MDVPGFDSEPRLVIPPGSPPGGAPVGRTPAHVAGLVRRVPPCDADTPGRLVRDAFLGDRTLVALPVVDAAGRAIGLVARSTLFERLAGDSGHGSIGLPPAAELMEPAPVVLDGDTGLDEAAARILSLEPAAGIDVFIVTRDGRYAGLGTGRDLVRALAERRHADLAHMADYDVLTGLPTRVPFERRLAQAIAAAVPRESIAVLFVDLDHFRQVNDTYGHRFGDLVICALGQRMRAAIRKSDLVARLSGDEFAFVLPGIRSAGDAESIARVLLNSCAAPVAIDGREVVVSCSIGLALYPQDGGTQETLLRAADTAQFYAKEVRNTCQRYVAEMAEWSRPLPGWTALRQALEAGDLDVHYQPVADLVTRRITGVEALVRWRHALVGPVPAADIVRVAEESGLIIPLTEYVMRAAMRQMRAWDEQTGRVDLRLAVNISAAQVHVGGLVPMIDRLLEQFSFDPRRLELELTERAAMRASDAAAATLQELKARGITLALDDFGTGYSALNRLERLPIDTLKIDKSFLEVIGTGDPVIARAIIALGRALGVRVIAEGVETAEQLAFLRAQGCECVQGFLLAPALRGEDLTPLLIDVVPQLANIL
jgi:diguanylate cyclase (GGDEF)-like protein